MFAKALVTLSLTIIFVGEIKGQKPRTSVPVENTDALVKTISERIVGNLKKVEKDRTVSGVITDAIENETNNLKKLSEAVGDKDTAAKLVSDKVRQSAKLRAVLEKESAKGATQARVIGAGIMGITQIITDVVKMTLTRY